MGQPQFFRNCRKTQRVDTATKYRKVDDPTSKLSILSKSAGEIR